MVMCELSIEIFVPGVVEYIECLCVVFLNLPLSISYLYDISIWYLLYSFLHIRTSWHVDRTTHTLHIEF